MSFYIYTAITGCYDSLTPLLSSAQMGVSFVAFLDSGHVSSDWQIRPACRAYDDHCRNAKEHKLLPHIYFPDATYSLYIDGSISLLNVNELLRLPQKYLRTTDIATFRHHRRKCIYTEAEACLEQGKDDPSKINYQIAKYRYECYPVDNGLAECCVILRRHSPRIQRFNELWWNEVSQYSRRDQLSFPYVLWKLKMDYTCFPGTARSNPLFQLKPHKIKSKRD